jgi:hypothetical protein
MKQLEKILVALWLDGVFTKKFKTTNNKVTTRERNH